MFSLSLSLSLCLSFCIYIEYYICICRERESVCVCIYLYTHVLFLRQYWQSFGPIYSCTATYVCKFVCICTYQDMHVYIYIYTYACIPVCKYVYAPYICTYHSKLWTVGNLIAVMYLGPSSLEGWGGVQACRRVVHHSCFPTSAR